MKNFNQFLKIQESEVQDPKSEVQDPEVTTLKKILDPTQKDLPTFVNTLKSVNFKNNTKVQEFIKAASNEDKIEFSSNAVPISASNLWPSQSEIGVKQSILDLIKITWGPERQIFELKQLLNPPATGVQLADPANPNGSPIFVANVGKKYWVVDGHHRWSKAFMANPETIMSCYVFTPYSSSVDIIQILKAFHLAIAKNKGESKTQDSLNPNLLTKGYDSKEYILQVANDPGNKKEFETMLNIWKEKFPEIDSAEKLADHLQKNVVLIQEKNPEKILGIKTPRPGMPQTGSSDDQENIETDFKIPAINYIPKTESKVKNFSNFMKTNEDHSDVETEIEKINSTGENTWIRLDKLKKLMSTYTDKESIDHVQRAITWLEKNPYQDRKNNNFGWD